VRDIYEVLREKEDAIERVRREVEALHSVTLLLADETDTRSNIRAGPAVRIEATTQTVSQQGEVLSTAAPLLADERDEALAKFRVRLIDAADNDSKLGRAREISHQLRNIVLHCCVPISGSARRLSPSFNEKPISAALRRKIAAALQLRWAKWQERKTA